MKVYSVFYKRRYILVDVSLDIVKLYFALAWLTDRYSSWGDEIEDFEIREKQKDSKSKNVLWKKI